MCGDLDDYDPSKHVELILEEVCRHTGKPSIAASKHWARDIAKLDLEEANREMLAHFMAMGSSVSNRRQENERIESIAQMAQIHAYLSGILTGVLLDDGTLQQIGLKKFLEGVNVGRSIDRNVSSDITYGHSNDQSHEHHCH